MRRLTIVKSQSRRILLVGVGAPALGIISKHLLVHCELNCVSLWPCTQIVHTSFQSLLPGIEVHTRQLTCTGIANVDIHTLTLANKGTAIGGHVKNGTLGDFPDSLVHMTDFIWDLGNVLDRSTIGNDLVTNLFCPVAISSELSE